MWLLRLLLLLLKQAGPGLGPGTLNQGLLLLSCWALGSAYQQGQQHGLGHNSVTGCRGGCEYFVCRDRLFKEAGRPVRYDWCVGTQIAQNSHSNAKGASLPGQAACEASGAVFTVHIVRSNQLCMPAACMNTTCISSACQ
jgi:hypothetical protein